jgi:hypothetical protein
MRTDGHDKANSNFRYFANAPKVLPDLHIVVSCSTKMFKKLHISPPPQDVLTHISHEAITFCRYSLQLLL